MGSSGLEMTTEEIVSYLKRSFIPTVLVEGCSDKSALRSLEKKINVPELDILPVLGKNRLHDVYVRRFELTDKKIVFVRDRDEYVACELPPDFGDYILTSGYSIENDVLDRDVLQRLSGEWFSQISRRIEMVGEWFRHVLQLYINGLPVEISKDVSWVLDGDDYSVEAGEQMAGVELRAPCDKLKPAFVWSWLRGKTLLRTIHSVFQEMDVGYSKDQLLHLCINMGPSADFMLLVGRIRDAVAPDASA